MSENGTPSTLDNMFAQERAKVEALLEELRHPAVCPFCGQPMPQEEAEPENDSKS